MNVLILKESVKRVLNPGLNCGLTTKKGRKPPRFFVALARRLGREPNVVPHHISDVSRLSASDYVKIFPFLLCVKQGSPANGGGTWVHHKLAVNLAQRKVECSGQLILSALT